MNPPFFLRTPPQCWLLLGCSSSLALLMSWGAPALADAVPMPSSQQFSDRLGAAMPDTRAYNPPNDSRVSGRDHTGGGVRGCGSDMLALAPRFMVGQSASSHPTFVWYMPVVTAAPMEFVLYQKHADGSIEVIFSDAVTQEQTGYLAYPLPASEPALAAGETYLWEVIQYCDPELQTVGRWISAEVDIIDRPVDLAPATTAVAIARTYAAQGLWYDALALVYDGATPEEQALRQDLLLDLADLEENPNDPLSVYLSNQLRMISEPTP